MRKSFEEQFLDAVSAVNRSVFDNGKVNKAKNSDAMQLRIDAPDMVYIDPPYYSPYSDNEYVRRYHFVEGLARNWEGVEIQQHTQTKSSSRILPLSLPEVERPMPLTFYLKNTPAAYSSYLIPQTVCRRSMRWFPFFLNIRSMLKLSRWITDILSVTRETA